MTSLLFVFPISLFLTLLLVRLIAYKFHDMKNYDRLNPRSSKARTFTGKLRRKTGYDWHHFHLGLLILIIILPIIYFRGLQITTSILLGFGVSLTVDQLIPIINKKSNYFNKDNLLISIIFHIVIAGVFITTFLLSS